MTRTDPIPGGAAEKSQAELEKEVEAIFDKEKIEKGINDIFPNGGKSGKAKKESVRTCIEEIKLDLLEAFKKEGEKSLAETIKKHLADIADRSFRAQKDISNQQAVDLLNVVKDSLRISKENQDTLSKDNSDIVSDTSIGKEVGGTSDIGTGKEMGEVIPSNELIKKITKPEAKVIVLYEFAPGIREKYLEGMSGKNLTLAKDRLVKYAKEIGAKIEKKKVLGEEIDENQIVLSVIGKVKKLCAIFEADLKASAAGITEKDDSVSGAGTDLEQNLVPEDEKKSPEFSKFLIALEEAKKNCAEQKVQSGAVQLIRMSPRKFGIIDNAELKLAYDAREKAYREIIGKMPRMENQGDNLTMAEFRAEFGEFKKNYYNDENVRLNIQKYDKRSGKAAIFIGESGKRQEVSIEELRKLRAVYKIAEKKKKPEGKGEKMTPAEFNAEFGDKLKKNLFDDSNKKMNIARYNRSGEATVYFGENGDKEDVSIEKLRELLAVYTNPEIKKKPEGKGKTFREVRDEVIALEEKSKADIRELRAERKLSEAALSDFLIDFSKIDLTGLRGGDKKKAHDLMKQKNESIRDFYIDKLKKSKKNPEAKKKSFREIFNEIDGLANKAMAEIKAGQEGGRLAEVNPDDYFVDISKLDLDGLNKTDEKKAKDLVGIKNEKILEYFKKAAGKKQKKGKKFAAEHKGRKPVQRDADEYEAGSKAYANGVYVNGSVPEDAKEEYAIKGKNRNNLKPAENEIKIAEAVSEETLVEDETDKEQLTESEGAKTDKDPIVEKPKEEEENIKKEAAAEQAGVQVEEKKSKKEREIDPEKEERLWAFIKSYIDGGIRYKKLVESEKVKTIEAASEQERQVRIRSMVEDLTAKTLDVLSRYSKEDREYIKKRVMSEIFG